MVKVLVYSTPTCPVCSRLKDFLKKNKVPFHDFNVQQDETRLHEMVKKSGAMSVPVIDINGKVIVGFDEGRIRRMLHLG